MKKLIGTMLLVLAVSCAVPNAEVRAQQFAPLTQEQKDQRWETEKELESVAIIER